MKKSLCILLFMAWTFCVVAQQYPPEWVQYTHSGYMCDIQSDINTRNLSETEFKNFLLDIARTNLAKQVSISVNDKATLITRAVDGHTSTVYNSSTTFSTDVDMSLVETRTRYDDSSKQGYAIAFINKSEACRYYRGELQTIINAIENSITIANNYVGLGFNERARNTLVEAERLFGRVDNPIFWLNIFNMPDYELQQFLTQINRLEQTIKQKIAELQHATTIYLSCSADIFGQNHPMFQNELKGIVSAEGCNFTDDRPSADFVINVRVVSREGNSATFNGMTSYFAYIDAVISIDKRVTGQRIYENEISVKGGHTRDYTEAARAGYRDLKKQLGSIIIKNIKQ